MEEKEGDPSVEDFEKLGMAGGLVRVVTEEEVREEGDRWSLGGWREAGVAKELEGEEEKEEVRWVRFLEKIGAMVDDDELEETEGFGQYIEEDAETEPEVADFGIPDCAVKLGGELF